MDCDENSPHFSQCPASSARVRRNMEGKSEEPSSEKVEWMLGVKTSRPKMSIEVCSSVCSDDGFMAHHCNNDEHDKDGGNYNPCSVYAHVEASQKDLQCGEDKVTAAAEMPNTKPKAGMLVACRQLIDGSEAASLEDQSDGAVSLASSNTTGTFSPPHADIVHIETMQRSIWGMPGSGAPNYRGTTRRTNSLSVAGILPQEQVRDKGFRGTPFHCL